MKCYSNTQFRYAMIYVLVTFAVLLFLNIYSSTASQKLLSNSKNISMVEKCQLAAEKVVRLEVLNTATVSGAFTQISSYRVDRMLVTDQYGFVIFDSVPKSDIQDEMALFPEIMQALQGYDVVNCVFKDGSIQSRAAIPVYTYGKLIGCIYMMEYDLEQGSLIDSLHNNILSITVILEIVVILFSLAFSRAFSKRIRRIMNSMRIIQEGDYSHKVTMGGHDELTFLGAEFNDLTERLQSSERKRSQFVSDASHELKTPLASIKLLADSILQNDMDMDTIREFVQDIGNEADRLNRMSQKLLALTRTENNGENNCEITTIVPTARRVVRMLSVIAKEKNVTIETDFPVDPTILIMEDDLYQIIFNLAENGIKYNVVGGHLKISLGIMDDNAILSVSDTGYGIPKESLDHIFERFYRVDKARSRQSGGSGLGLSIVRTMVERNSGTITAESTLGKGTTFTVTFPVFDTLEENS